MNEVRDAAIDLVQKWLKAADEFLKNDATPRRVSARRWFRNELVYVYGDVTVLGWHLEDIIRATALPEWDAAVKQLMLDNRVRSQFENGGFSFDNRWWPLTVDMLPGLMLQSSVSLMEDHSPEVTEEMRQNAAALITMLFDDSVCAVAICPVFGLQGTASVTLEDRLELKRTDDALIIELLDAGVLRAFFQNQMVWAHMVPDYVLELRFIHKKQLNHPEIEDPGVHVDLERREKVLGALSLLGKGRVEIDGVEIGYEPRSMFGAAIVPASTEMYQLPRTINVTDLLTDLPFAYSAVRSLNTHKGLSLALRRVTQSAARNYPEDRILDLMIAVEALFLPGERLELGYKLSVRSAYYLAPKDPEQRRRIYEIMKAAYSVRGGVAHGAPIDDHVKLLGKDVPISDFLDEVEVLVRLALRKRILETAPPQEKIEFDALVVGPKT